MVVVDSMAACSWTPIIASLYTKVHTYYRSTLTVGGRQVGPVSAKAFHV